MKRMLFVYNPRSGKGEIRNKLAAVIDELTSTGYELTVYPTRAALDAKRIIQEKGKNYDIIVCSGGDGTLDEAVTGMQNGGLDIPLGYIPAGSTNDFATSLGIPKNMQHAARDVVNGSVFRCDLGKLNDDFFVYVAAFGMFTEVAYKTSQEWKNALGHLAYLLEGIRSLSAVKGWPLRIESPEWRGEGRFLYGMITNSDSVGGFKGITGRNVSLNDGVFEVTLIKEPDNVIEWPGIINSLLVKETNEYVITFKTQRLEIYSEEELPWTRDGEYGGSYQYSRIENIAEAIPIIVADKDEEAENVSYEDDDEFGVFSSDN